MQNGDNEPRSLGNIAVIGVGGIGSWFCEIMYHLMLGQQIEYRSLCVYDPDVVERKNLKHQKFFNKEIGHYKAFVAGLRMPSARNAEFLNIRFEEKHLADHTTFIICADNAQVRYLVYNHVYAVNTELLIAKRFLDMRCEGRKFMVCNNYCDKETLIASLGVTPESAQGRSCQLATDTLQSRIQCGPWAVSSVGAQMLLDMARGTRVSDTLIYSDVIPEASI